MKKRKSRIALTLVLYLVSCGISFSQEPIIFKYETFMDRVIQNNPLMERANNVSMIGNLQYKSARGGYDPIIAGNYSNKFYKGTNYYSELNSMVKQPLFTSQYLKFGYDYGVGANINAESMTSQSGLMYMGLEVDLLQGLVIDYRRANVLKTKEYVNYFNAEKDIQINNLLFESSQRYFDWLLTNKLVSLNKYFLNLATLRMGGVRDLTNIGERPAVDTVEALIFLQSRELDLQTATIDNQKAIYDLLPLANISSDISSVSSSIIVSDSLDMYYERASLNYFNLLNQDTINNPVILKYNSFQNVLAIESRLKKEMIKPKLNVNYNFLTSGSEYNVSSNNYKWGLNLSFPLLFRSSLNDYKIANLNLKNNSLELRNKSNELNFKIKLLKKNIDVLNSQILNATTNVKFSKQLVEAEKLKFIGGESSLFVLNARESKWLETEVKLAEYKVKYIKAVLNIIYLQGNLNYKM